MSVSLSLGCGFAKAGVVHFYFLVIRPASRAFMAVRYYLRRTQTGGGGDQLSQEKSLPGNKSKDKQ
jgi:hypothetical protein